MHFRKLNRKNLIENLIKYGLTKEVNFTITILKNGYEIIIFKCIQHIMKENLLLLKDSLEQ